MSLGAGFSASALGSNGSTNQDTPHSIFCTFYGDAKSSRGFTWFTDNSGDDTQIMVGKSSSLSDATTYTNGTTYTVTGGDRSDGTKSETSLTEYGHKITVSGLTAGTKYYYKVGSSKGWSTVGSFTTQGSGNSFSFIDVTDTQASMYGSDVAAAQAANNDYSTNFAPLLKQAFSTAPDASFVMDNGDITENGNDLKQWNLLASAAGDNLMNTTFVPVAGNHETYDANDENNQIHIANSYSGFSYDKANAQSGVPVVDDTKGSTTNQAFGTCGFADNVFTNHFNLSLPSTEDASQTKKGAYYSFDYANAHIMVLNTNDLIQTSVYDSSTKKETTVGGTLSAAQVSWLKADAAASNAKWKIVVFHRAVQSSGSHTAQPDIKALRAQIIPLMTTCGIDLVLQGHDHSYLRSKQISGVGGTPNPVVSPAEVTETYNGASTTFGVNPLGTIYVIPGASDNKMYIAPSTANAAGIFPAVTFPAFDSNSTLDPTYDPANNSDSKAPTYAVIKIDGDKLTLNAYQYDIPNKTQKVLDTYGIAKPDQTALVNQINALPSADKLTTKDEAAVKAAYDAYMVLDAIGKAGVTNADVLLDDVQLLQQMDPTFLATSSNPKTGSENNFALIIVLAGLFCTVLTVSVIAKRKKASADR